MPPRAPTASLERAALARKLRELRERRWSDFTLTQTALAEALGGLKSSSLISSWESPASDAAPTPQRLRTYATFFATRRSIEGPRPRVLTDDELDDDERAERDQMFAELLALRDGPPSLQPTLTASREGSSWWFA